jgi:hypothetical protein
MLQDFLQTLTFLAWLYYSTMDRLDTIVFLNKSIGSSSSLDTFLTVLFIVIALIVLIPICCCCFGIFGAAAVINRQNREPLVVRTDIRTGDRQFNVPYPASGPIDPYAIPPYSNPMPTQSYYAPISAAQPGPYERDSRNNYPPPLYQPYPPPTYPPRDPEPSAPYFNQ